MTIQRKSSHSDAFIPGQGRWLCVSVSTANYEPHIVRLPSKADVIDYYRSIRSSYIEKGIYTMGGFDDRCQQYFDPDTKEFIGSTRHFYIPARDPEYADTDTGDDTQADEADNAE